MINKKNNERVIEFDEKNFAFVDPNCGMLVGCVLGGKEIIHNSDNTSRRGIPILFPFANPLNDDTFDITGLQCPQHGFVRKHGWSYSENNHTNCTLIIDSDMISDNYKVFYPFSFELVQKINIGDSFLEINLEIINKGDVEMPIAPGFHPYFAIKESERARLKIISGKENINLGINWDETSSGYYFDYIDNTKLIYPSGHCVKIGSSITSEDDGYKIEKLVLWSEPKSDFICVEQFARGTNGLNDNPIMVQANTTVNFSLRVTI